MRNRLFVLFLILLLSATVVFAGGKKDNQSADSTNQDEASTQATEPEPEDTAPGTVIALGGTEDFAATVNGVGILTDELERTVEGTRQTYAAQGQYLTADDIALVRSQLLEQLIAQELLYQDGLSKKLIVDQASVDLQYQQMRAQFQTDAEWQQALDRTNLTEDVLKMQLQRGDIVRQVAAAAVEGLAAPTQTEIEDFYAANMVYFETPEQITASHILISTEGMTTDADLADALARAEAIRAELLAGADFVALAQEKSEGPSGPRGGDLGTFGPGQMVAPFEEAAFALEVGEISEVVQTQFGYHVILLTGRTEASSLPLEDVSESISQYLVQQAQAAAVDQYVTGLRDAGDVKVVSTED